MINNEKIERVYVTNFLGVQIDAQLNWKGTSNILVKSFQNVLVYLQKHEKCYTNHVLLTYTILLHIHILYIVTMFGAMHIRPI